MRQPGNKVKRRARPGMVGTVSFERGGFVEVTWPSRQTTLEWGAELVDADA